MYIQGLGAFNRYDTLVNGKSDGKISLAEFSLNKEQFVKDFKDLPISERINVLAKMDKSARKALEEALVKELFQNFNHKAVSVLTLMSDKYMVSDYFSRKVGKAIEFALRTGSADEISLEDFDHGHVLIPYDELKHYQGVTTDRQLESLLSSRGCVILYHTQELTGKFREPHNYHRRNLVQGPDGKVRTARHRLYCDEKEVEHSSGVDPRDLDATYVGELKFELDPNGKYSFVHKGKVYHYSAYVSLESQSMQTKIDTLDKIIRPEAPHWCDHFSSNADLE